MPTVACCTSVNVPNLSVKKFVQLFISCYNYRSKCAFINRTSWKIWLRSGLVLVAYINCPSWIGSWRHLLLQAVPDWKNTSYVWGSSGSICGRRFSRLWIIWTCNKLNLKASKQTLHLDFWSLSSWRKVHFDLEALDRTVWSRICTRIA